MIGNATQPTSMAEFMPHGFCVLWRPDLLWLHVVSDAIIAASYYSIPAALVYFLVKRTDFPYRWIIGLFSIFILACGTTHLMEIWTIWHPDYWAEGLIKAVTALVSAASAMAIWPLIPKTLQIPSLSMLERAYRELQKEVAERIKTENRYRALNDDLEKIVASRTRELTEANARLTEEMVQRSHAEQSLRDSEQRYRALFDLMPESIVVVDAESGEICDFNRVAHEHLGYSREEFQKLAVNDIDRFDSKMDFEERLKEIFHTGGALFETQHIHKDGRTFDSFVNLKLVQINGRNLVQGIWTDISDFKRLEQELRTSKERIDHILNASPAAIYVLTPCEHPSSSFAVTFISDSIAKITGFGHTDWTTSKTFWLDHVHPEDRPNALAERLRDSDSDWLVSRYRFRCRDGAYRWIHDELQLFRDRSGAVQEVIGAWMDITKLRVAEEALSRSLLMQRAMLDTANDGFLLLDGDGVIRQANPSSCRMLGIAEERLLGNRLAEFAANGAELSEEMSQVTTVGSSRFDTTLRCRHGNPIDVEVSVNAFPDHRNQQQYVCFIRDISERKKSESKRLAEVEQQRITLINEVHHRIKNNLQGMVGLLGLYLHSHPAQAGLINAIIGKIKSVAVVFGLQGQRGEDDIRLCEITGEICRGAEHLAGNPIAPHLDVTVDQPIRLNKTKAVAVGLIINELVVNALKHSPPGTAIPTSIRVSADAGSASVRIVNPSFGLPAGFDIERGTGLGTGLSLVKAMMPQEGTMLSISESDGMVTTMLQLSSPAIVVVDG